MVCTLLRHTFSICSRTFLSIYVELWERASAPRGTVDSVHSRDTP